MNPTQLHNEKRQTAAEDLSPDARGSARSDDSTPQVNVGKDERALSIAAGSILVLTGLRRFNLPGLLIAGVGGALLQRGVTGNCQLYRQLDIDSSQGSPQATASGQVRIMQAVTIGKSREELYRFWKDFANLPNTLSHLKQVAQVEEGHWRWTAESTGVFGGELEWETEMVEDRENERLAWRTVADSPVSHTGSVSFQSAPGERGTVVRVEINYRAPAGRLTAWLDGLWGQSPELQVREDLRRFKQKMEVGESPTVEGQPAGTCLSQSARSE